MSKEPKVHWWKYYGNYSYGVACGTPFCVRRVEFVKEWQFDRTKDEYKCLNCKRIREKAIREGKK